MQPTQRPFLRRLVVLSAVLVAFACGNQAGSRYVKSQNIDAASGGTLSVTATESAALAGTSLAIPAGALAADTRITLELGMDDLVAREDVAGPVAIWGPAGTRFSKKARMTLPLSISAAAGELTVQVREADGREFELPTSAVQVADGRISFDVDGFTSFQPRRRSTTACPADAKLCPDGSSVGRTGPNCTFPACPGEDGGAMCSPPVCTLACQYGFARDAATGCQVCRCNPGPTDGGAVGCPKDARLCPDGSTVSRTGPNCTFPACPATDGGATVCTADAFQCADGTVVGRSGPNCEFICPGVSDGGSACTPPVCTLACQYGFARDPATGCQVCSCNPAPAVDGGPVVCTADAFQCPDGTFVGRSGPDCRFVCPASDAGVCSPVVCTLACQYGFARDPATGCEQCRCNPGPALDGGAAPCFRGGCSNQLCSDQPGLGSTCEWRAEYACYQQAACERQPNGTCGHTPSATLTACLANAADGGQP
jgi:hypothetical protein